MDNDLLVANEAASKQSQSQQSLNKCGRLLGIRPSLESSLRLAKNLNAARFQGTRLSDELKSLRKHYVSINYFT